MLFTYLFNVFCMIYGNINSACGELIPVKSGSQFLTKSYN